MYIHIHHTLTYIHRSHTFVHIVTARTYTHCLRISCTHTFTVRIPLYIYSPSAHLCTYIHRPHTHTHCLRIACTHTHTAYASRTRTHIFAVHADYIPAHTRIVHT